MEGVFPGQHTVDLNLRIFPSAGHSCWVSSQVEVFASRAAFSAPGWERLRNAAVSAPVTEQRRKPGGLSAMESASNPEIREGRSQSF